MHVSPSPSSFSSALPVSHWPNLKTIHLKTTHCRVPPSLRLLRPLPPSFSAATMIKTLIPYSNGPSAATTSKTDEIMSRYRPIAPKPEIPVTDQSPSPTSSSPTSSLSQKIRQSPYLRNLWPQLQARPTRTRKRGRNAISPPDLKRQRANYQHVPPLSPPSTATSNLSFHAFSHHHQLRLPIISLAAADHMVASPRSLVTLPLLPCPTSEDGESVLDLNLVSHVTEIPEEKDLLQQLQKASATTVIVPQPIRPIVSRISVGSIIEDVITPGTPPAQELKKPEEVEEEMESEALPSVISDSNHKVRLSNSAYKEMVGQPECLWLDSMLGMSPCKRISGEVMLRILDDQKKVGALSSKFSCCVRIEWCNNQGKKNVMDAFCDVKRLFCESKDYLFSWRFHTNTSRAAQPSSV